MLPTIRPIDTRDDSTPKKKGNVSISVIERTCLTKDFTWHVKTWNKLYCITCIKLEGNCTVPPILLIGVTRHNLVYFISPEGQWSDLSGLRKSQKDRLKIVKRNRRKDRLNLDGEKLISLDNFFFLSLDNLDILFEDFLGGYHIPLSPPSTLPSSRLWYVRRPIVKIDVV